MTAATEAVPFSALLLMGARTTVMPKQNPLHLPRHPLVEDVGQHAPEVRMIGGIQ
jgi:hypothetical protein